MPPEVSPPVYAGALAPAQGKPLAASRPLYHASAGPPLARSPLAATVAPAPPAPKRSLPAAHPPAKRLCREEEAWAWAVGAPPLPTGRPAPPSSLGVILRPKGPMASAPPPATTPVAAASATAAAAAPQATPQPVLTPTLVAALSPTASPTVASSSRLPQCNEAAPRPGPPPTPKIPGSQAAHWLLELPTSAEPTETEEWGWWPEAAAAGWGWDGEGAGADLFDTAAAASSSSTTFTEAPPSRSSAPPVACGPIAPRAGEEAVRRGPPVTPKVPGSRTLQPSSDTDDWWWPEGQLTSGDVTHLYDGYASSTATEDGLHPSSAAGMQAWWSQFASKAMKLVNKPPPPRPAPPLAARPLPPSSSAQPRDPKTTGEPEPKPIDPNAVDPRTGIRNADLRDSVAAELLSTRRRWAELRLPTPAAPPRPPTGPRPPGHRPDPADRQFPPPILPTEAMKRRRARRSMTGRYLTEADCLKLFRFNITWDCLSCLYSFLDQASLQAHQGRCAGMAGPVRGPFVCHFCQRECNTAAALDGHVDHVHGELKEAKEEFRVELLKRQVGKIQRWVDDCSIKSDMVESCLHTLHQLHDSLVLTSVYLHSEETSKRQLAGRELMVMVDIAVKATALGCSTAAMSVADLTNANPSVVAGLFHAISHLETYGILPVSLRQRVDDTRRQRNVVFHTLGVVLEDPMLQRQCQLATDVLRWAQGLMDRTLNVVAACAPPPEPTPVSPIANPVAGPHLPSPAPTPVPSAAPTLPPATCQPPPCPPASAFRPPAPSPASPAATPGAAAAAAAAATASSSSSSAPSAAPPGRSNGLPPGMVLIPHTGNQTGIPAWKHSAPAVPILGTARGLLGVPPELQRATEL